MGLFGKSRHERQKEEAQREHDYRTLCEKAKVWGWDRQKAEAQGVHKPELSTDALKQNCSIYLQEINAVETGTANHDTVRRFMLKITDYPVAIRHPQFPFLLSKLLDWLESEDRKHLVWTIQLTEHFKMLREADRERIRSYLLNAAEKENQPILISMCENAGCLDELERIWRNRFGDSYSVFKLLRRREKWDACIAWCHEYRAFRDCVDVLEECERFSEAVDLLTKIGWANWSGGSGKTNQEIKDDFERKLERLRGLAAAAGQTDAKPTPNLAALDEKFAYGEISKAEYDKLKAQAAAPAAKTCPACGQPVEPAHQFCPHCGAVATNMHE